jgi:hypothetical protein
MYSPKTYVGLLENEAGSWLGDDIVSYSVIDTSLAKVSFGLSRKAGQGGISGSGTVAKLKVTLRNIDPVETELTLQNVVAIDPAGNPIQFDVANRTITAAADLAVICSLTGFELHQNYPNPFNPVTTIEFWLPQAGQVDLIILDTNGKEVQQLFHQIKPAGYHSVSWDGRNNVRQNVSSGVYFYRLEVKGQESIFWDVKKMILIR